MSAANGYLLDTNIVLHATREKSPVALAVDSRYQLRASPFRPTICEVTVAELWAFAQSWGDKRKELLKQVIGDLLILPIADPRIHHRWAELYSHARSNGLPIQQDHCLQGDRQSCATSSRDRKCRTEAGKGLASLGESSERTNHAI